MMVQHIVLANEQGLTFDKLNCSNDPITLDEALEWCSGRGREYTALLETTTGAVHFYSFSGDSYKFILHL